MRVWVRVEREEREVVESCWFCGGGDRSIRDERKGRKGEERGAEKDVRLFVKRGSRIGKGWIRGRKFDGGCIGCAEMKAKTKRI